jgi:group I intron endonuclease
MKYTVYKITNKINGKVYIGKHQTKNPYDTYMGSGRAIKHAMKEYGKENFEKEVLFIFDKSVEMDDKERELVNETFISTDKNYNLGVGGEGGPHFLGKKHSEETKKRLSEKMKGNKISDESRKKISESNRTRKISEDTKRKLSEKAKLRYRGEHSEEIRTKISESIKKLHQSGRYKKNRIVD